MSPEARGYDPDLRLKAIDAEFALKVGRRLHAAGLKRVTGVVSAVGHIPEDSTVGEVMQKELADRRIETDFNPSASELGPDYIVLDGEEFCPPESVAVWIPRDPEA